MKDLVDNLSVPEETEVTFQVPQETRMTLQSRLKKMRKEEGLFVFISGSLEIGAEPSGTPGELIVDDGYLEIQPDMTGAVMDGTSVFLKKADIEKMLKLLGMV